MRPIFKIFLSLIFGLLAFAGTASAQFTQVSATVTDPNGTPWAFATMSANLNATPGVTPTLNGSSFSANSGLTQLDANGHFVVRLADNNVVSPAGTTWTFNICTTNAQQVPGFGPQCFSVTMTISGTTQNISANLSNASPALLRNSGSLTPALPNTQIFVGNILNIATPVPLSGDATITNAGVLTLNNIQGNPVLYTSPLQGQIMAVNSLGVLTNVFPGVTVDSRSSATPTITGDGVGSDRGGLVLTTNNTTSTATALPQAGSAGFGSSFPFATCNTGSVVNTVTPATSTVNGNATLVLQPQPASGNPECAIFWSGGGQWNAAEILPTDANGLLPASFLPPTAVTAAAALTNCYSTIGVGSRALQTTPVSCDVSVETGSDMAAQIASTWSTLSAANTGGGEADARSFNGIQNVAGSMFTNYPGSNVFNGLLNLKNSNIVTAVTQTVPNGAIIEGNSGHPTSGPTFTYTGVTIQPANGFPTSTPILALAAAGGQHLNNFRLSCLPPNGTFISGSIGLQNSLAQESAQTNNLFIDSCDVGMAINSANAQNEGPHFNTQISFNGVTDTGALAVQYGSLAANTDPDRGFFGATFNGGGATSEILTAVAIDGSNIPFISIHCEEFVTCFEVGANQASTGALLMNIHGVSSPSMPMTSIIDLSSAHIVRAFCALDVYNEGNANVTNLLVDHNTNGGTIAASVESSLAFYCRGINNTVFTSSAQIGDTFPAHNENFRAGTIELPGGAGFVSSATSNLGVNTTNNAFKIWTGVDSLTDFFPNSAPPAGGFFTKTSGVIGQLSESTLSGIQGTDVNVMSAGTVSGTSAALCTDANGGATTTACPSAATGNSVASTTAATVTNPTANTDTQLMELSLPANFLNTLNQPFVIKGGGTYSTGAASSPAFTFKAKLCSVSGCGSGTVTTLAAIVSGAGSATATTNATWNLDLVATPSVSGANCALIVKGSPGLTIDLSNVVAAADTIYSDVNTAASSPTQNCANALFLDFDVAISATGASNSITQLQGVIAPQVASTAATTPNNAIITGWCVGTAGASSTLFIPPFNSNSATSCTSSATAGLGASGRGYPAPWTGTLKNLQVSAITGGVNSSSGVFTVFVNGSATSITCTTGTATSCSDLTHTAAITQGQQYQIKFTTQASETLANLTLTLQLQ